MTNTLDLTIDLINRPSVTPEDEGCQALLAERLAALGFNNEHLRFDDVDNLWSVYGTRGPLFVFAGHTDVVPTGPEANWSHPPFQATIDNGLLYGRGTADMKGSIAAMVTATERYFANGHQPKGRIGFLITSDEEGPSINGTVKVVEYLEQKNEKIDWCLVGEPSSTNKLGDVIKNGRRGSLGCELTIKGKQGHVAYPHLADNPVHRAAPFIAELCAQQWDQGNDFFPPTTFQISNINAGTGATNVIPGDLHMVFNFRFSTEVTEEQLRQRVDALIAKHALQHDIKWTLSGHPFLTAKGKLVEAVSESIQQVCGYTTELSTAGGTSDGRFIAPTGAQVVELGPLNATIHKVDEHVAVDDLDKLSAVYEQVLVKLLG